MNKWFLASLLLIGFASCKSKKLDSTKAYFSVVDYLKAEVKKMDSLPLRFTKITVMDSIADTTGIAREEFQKYASEFTDIPDIASSRQMDDYTETNDFDEVLNNVLLMYTPKKQDGEVRNETIMMQPDDAGNTYVKTILITTQKAESDSSVTKNMTWHVGHRFQIVTKTNKSNQPEKIKTVIVSWE